MNKNYFYYKLYHRYACSTIAELSPISELELQFLKHMLKNFKQCIETYYNVVIDISDRFNSMIVY